jgi:hypothetical protein
VRTVCGLNPADHITPSTLKGARDEHLKKAFFEKFIFNYSDV